MDCIILGDSIAVGAHAFRPECAMYAKGGINSYQWNRGWSQVRLDADTVIISLSTNDYRGIDTRTELKKMRERVIAKRVFWILPAGTAPDSGVSVVTIQSIVREVAGQYKDFVLEIPRLQADHIHPSWDGYKLLMEQTK